jgi:RNA polymerase sigma-70 factor, ECF subfamily
MPSDAEVLQRVGQGDVVAFDELYSRYHDPVLRHLTRIVGTAETAEDLVQETFLRVWTRAGQWQMRGSAAGWIYGIATNLALNALRSRRLDASRSMSGTEPDEEDLLARVADSASCGPEQSALRNELIQLIRESVQALSEDKRAVLQLSLDHGITLAEISKRLGIPLGTVKSRYHFASRELRERMPREGQGRES